MGKEQEKIALAAIPGFYHHGRRYDCRLEPAANGFSLSPLRIEGGAEILVGERELCLLSALLRPLPALPDLRPVAIADDSASAPGPFFRESQGNVIWGEVSRGAFLSTLMLRGAIFHRPHLLRRLWRVLLLQDRIGAIRTVMPDRSPFSAFFPRRRSGFRLWLRWPEGVPDGGIHFILPATGGEHEH